MSLKPKKPTLPKGKTVKARFKSFSTVQGQTLGGLSKMGVVDKENQTVTFMYPPYRVVWNYDAKTSKTAGKYGEMYQKVRVSKPKIDVAGKTTTDIPPSLHRKIEVKIQKAQKHSLKQAKAEMEATKRGAESAKGVAAAVSEEAGKWANVVAKVKGGKGAD